MAAFVLYLLFVAIQSTSGLQCNIDCIYRNCPEVKSDKLNIHLVPHTHDDAGWLKTVDQYYYGGNHRHAPFGVQYIIDSVLAELEADERRRFVYVESSFLWRWWIDRSEGARERMRRLVKEGRLQLLHGGWVMSDEATPHYSALIDQMSFGLRFLKEEILGDCEGPDVAWQIDAFGHSSEVALEFTDMGFQGVFFGRIDFEDYEERRYSNSLEMIWRPDTREGTTGDIFAGVLYNLYHPPIGYCFDVFCQEEPIMDNPKLHGYNVAQRVRQFIYHCRVWATSYATQNVMVPMGGDFNYMVAASWFTNMDKLIKHGNRMYRDVNIIYSTPACYLQALQKSNVTWPVKENNDFFPYISNDMYKWTGYYTSRPTLKYMTYRMNNLLQAVKKMTVVLGKEVKEEVFVIEQSVALLQHHDAVSGTEKQHVADDYALYLEEALDAGQIVFTAAYRKWLGTDYPEQTFCPLVNISVCEVSERNMRFVVNLFNPLPWPLSVPVRLPVTQPLYVVTSDAGVVESEMLGLGKEILRLMGRESLAREDLYFLAEEIPALGFRSYHVQPVVRPLPPPPPPQPKQTSGKEVIVSNEEVRFYHFCVGDIRMKTHFCKHRPINNGSCLTVTFYQEPNDGRVPNVELVFDSITGLLKSIKREGEVFPFKQNFYFYHSQYSTSSNPSGAYAFGPSNNTPSVLSKHANFTIRKGKNVVEVHQKFKDWASQIIRIYKGSDSVEFNWMIGPIEISYDSKDIVTRYETDLETEGIFYTDSNGRRWMRRQYKHDNGVSSNYYPVTTAAKLSSNTFSFIVLTDRPQGATSPHDGQLEFMLHRRLLTDDGKGVSEPLNERAFGYGLVARGTHVLYFVNKEIGESTAAKFHRLKSASTSFAPWLSLSSTHLDAETWKSTYHMQLQPILESPLPENVNILTLERRQPNKFLLRLEHLFEIGEHPELSSTIYLSLKDMFKGFTVVEAVEMTLAGDRAKDCVKKMKWKSNAKEEQVPLVNHFDPRNLSLSLRPMQIRTFLLTVNTSNV